MTREHVPENAAGERPRVPVRSSFASQQTSPGLLLLLPAMMGVIIFAIAPWVTALNLRNSEGLATAYPGWPLLFFGWFELLSLFDGRPSGIGWLANPCFAVGTLAIFLGHRRFALAAMFAAVLFSLASFWLFEVPMDEGGNLSRIVGYNIGFWLWMGAIWWNCFAALLILLLDRVTWPERGTVK